MGQLAGALGGGGGAMPSVSVSPSSSAASGPQAGTTGSLILDFGGINLGNQDIPLNAESTAASNAAPTIGTVASLSSLAARVDAYLPTLLVIGAVVALAFWIKGRTK